MTDKHLEAGMEKHVAELRESLEGAGLTQLVYAIARHAYRAGWKAAGAAGEAQLKRLIEVFERQEKESNDKSEEVEEL